MARQQNLFKRYLSSTEYLISERRAVSRSACHVPVAEYVKVLQRLGLRDEQQLMELLSLFAQGPHVLYTATIPKLTIIDIDPTDNKFIECAVALQSSYIVSGDRHLQSIKNYMGIKVVSPAEFLDAVFSFPGNLI